MLRKLFVVLLSLFTITGCQLESHRDSFMASQTPYGRYDQKVTYTIAHLKGTNNSNMPDGDTYENNAYTRYLLKKLNVQNKDIFEGYGVHYSEYVDHAILSKKLPDVMIVESLDDLEYLVENHLIEDLTTAYKQCASPRIKDMYASYDASILDNVTFNGKIYAMPETNIDDGPNFFWVRDDWRKELFALVLQRFVIAIIVQSRPRAYGPTIVELPIERAVASTKVSTPMFGCVLDTLGLAQLR